eukprot:Tamp_07484.p1 GENE.Tamp_07484~~Tamp_07484.p1  ORF type:complete len:654 (-),score=134.46 Tamp_07484:393-2354(-)
MGKLPTPVAGSGAWRSVTLEIPVPAVVEAGLAAAAAHLQHVTLLHVVVAAALALFVRALLQRSVPRVVLTSVGDDAEEKDVIEGRKLLDARKASPKDAPPGYIRCWDPATMQDLGAVKAFSKEDVLAAVARAKAAQAKWKTSSFAQRRHLLHVISRCITENMETVTRVACRDSGKAKVDAYMGEVLTTLEKIRWLCSQGERFLVPEYRESGLLNMHKTSRVEYHPVGVVGAIVPWNYPLHNVFNPLLAAIFAGNGIVIKTSEYASWSTQFFGRLIKSCLAAAGAPEDLALIVTGFGDAGHALVTGGVDKVIFVGSVDVGKKVQEACIPRLTPLVLELGGKDAFVICDDASPKAIAQLACRGVFQNMGQNCAGPERFLVYEKVYDDFCARMLHIVTSMKQGPPLSSSQVDCGAVRLPQHIKHLQELVNDAVSKGARLLAGGFTPTGASRLGAAQFYPPTILADVDERMLIWREEIFGPILCITKVKGSGEAGDAEAVRLANACDFALSSCAFSRSGKRASKLVSSFEAGMGSVNDLEGTTYISQALPFGGSKMSGYDRFAGPEGLRGLCHVKSVVADRFVYRGGPFLALPDQIAYPATGQGPGFCGGLMKMLYGHSLAARISGIKDIIMWSVIKPKAEPLPTLKDDAAEHAKKS